MPSLPMIHLPLRTNREVTLPFVETDFGPISGDRTGDLSVFRGVPYARADRFRENTPPSPWSETRPCTTFGPSPAQSRDKLERIWGARLDPGSEDCLSANVWTPDVSGRRPVLVLVHGGAFQIGGSAWPWFDGANFARTGDLVVFSFNYRVGAFGYLDLRELGGPDYARSGNLGLLDQITAIEWIKRHATRFGGDPNNITVCGQSAGAISVACLLAVPRAKGLFQRAILMSGAGNLVRSTERAAHVTRRFMKLARARTVADLERLTTAQVLAVQSKLFDKPESLGELPFGPVIDPAVLPVPPHQAIANGAASDVQLLVGTTSDEVRLWTLYNGILDWLFPGTLRSWFKRLGLDFADALRVYKDEHPLETQPQLTMSIASDAIFRLPAIRLVEAQNRHRADTRMYLFAYQTTAYGGQLGAAHAADMPFAFGTLDAPGATLLTGDSPERAMVSESMMNRWIDFARSGDLDWPPYKPDNRQVFVFDRVSSTVVDPQPKTRELWSNLPFDSVVPPAHEMPRTRDILLYFAFWLTLTVGGMAFLTCAVTIALAFGK